MTFALVMLGLTVLELAAVGLLVRRARRRAAAIGTPERAAHFDPEVRDSFAPPAGSLLEDVVATALAEMYGFQRQHSRAPETFGISAEADAELRAQWKRELERSMPAEEAKQFIASYGAGPMVLYGLRVEVREDLVGAEVAVA